ncbi:hypothetical protein [Streptomyces achromogenes]|uniref:hypothetical protein n=1 Tax=Streptomyces achromogenes TaxID=67255 RepID=UPI003A8063A8
MTLTDPTAAIEVWARMLCSADVHVYGADHPTWQQLVGEPGSKIRDDYRKAAAWLLPRLTVAAAPASPAPATDRDTLRERIARAIYSSDWPCGTWEMRPEEEHATYLRNADAVLAVLPAPDQQTSFAAGLRAAADEIAGIDFHPNARARSLDIADGLYRRLRRMADELQPPPVKAAGPQVCGAREPEPRTGTSPCVLPAGHGGTKHQDKWTNQWPIDLVARSGQPETNEETHRV